MLKRVFLVSARILLCTNREADYLSHAAASSVLAISHFLPLSESPPRSCITCITCKFYAVCCQRRAQFFNLHKHWVGCGRCSSAQRHSFGVPAAMHMDWSADTGIFSKMFSSSEGAGGMGVGSGVWMRQVVCIRI
jgi:hypothetical protein